MSVFSPRVGLSLQAQEPRLQFFHRKLSNQGCSYTSDLMDVVAFQLFSTPHPLFGIWTDFKRSQGHQRGGEESGFG